MIAPMNAADAAPLAEIERASSASPWSARQIAEELAKPRSRFRVVREGGAAVAYAGFWLVEDEAQLANIAVHPAFRRRGHGRRLLAALIDEARALGARRMTLEVREGNAAARRLYEAQGFRETSRRPRFYENAETAVLMERPL